MFKFKNTNGNEYNVLAKKGDYTLLEKLNGRKEYVVAWRLEECVDNLYTWGQGHYFGELEDAQEYFDKK